MQYIIPHMNHDVFCISITTNKIIKTWEGAISRILSYHLMRFTWFSSTYHTPSQSVF